MSSPLTLIENKAREVNTKFSGPKIIMDSKINHIDAKIVKNLLNQLGDPKTSYYHNEIDLSAAISMDDEAAELLLLMGP